MYIYLYGCIFIYMNVGLCIFYMHMYIYSKTSLNRSTTGQPLSGPFREVVGLRSENIVMSDRLGPK